MAQIITSHIQSYLYQDQFIDITLLIQVLFPLLNTSLKNKFRPSSRGGGGGGGGG